jgi:hypothetical protein
MSNVTALRRPANRMIPGPADKKLAAEYRALEPDICDIVRAAEMLSLAEDQEDTGLLSFAINQSLKLAEELKEKYYEAYKG